MSTQQDQSEAQAFEKRAEIAKTDSDRQIAVGVAMVPNSVDRSGDFERAETIQRASEGYMERLAAGEAKSGVMHADFDDDALTHVENRVLDKAESIGGERYPAGTWAVSKRVDDDALWKLVENGTLSGFSIGGYVHDAETYDTDDGLPEGVEYGAEWEASEEPFREITDATIEEVSLVDTPAVPEAQVLTAKGDGLLKANPALTAGTETATEYLVNERGHDEQSARDLAEYLNRMDKSAGSATADDGGSWLSRARSFFTPRGRGSGGQDTPPDDHDMTDKADTDGETEKAGRTLNAKNVDRTKAVHDLAIDMLDESDVSQNRLRFTDDVSTSFDVNEFQSKESSDSPSGESGRDAGTDKAMSDTDIKEMLKSIQETQEEQAERMDALESDDEEKSEDGDDPVVELAETVESLADQQSDILDRIENAEGASQQKANGTANADDGVSKADLLGIPSMGGD